MSNLNKKLVVDNVKANENCQESRLVSDSANENCQEPRLVNDTVTGFLGKLGSGDPTPGGGAAASLSSAMGASLLMMVANHTIGKKRYEELEALNLEVRSSAEELLAILEDGIDEDAIAFGKVSAAYGMPRTTDEEKTARSAAIGEASVSAANAPMKVMEASLEGLHLAKQLKGNSNPNLESDILVAALSFNSGLVSASYNVEANLSGIRKKDPDLADRMKTRSDDIISEAAELVGEITWKSQDAKR